MAHLGPAAPCRAFPANARGRVLLRRLLKFSLVGAAGIAVQLTTLWLLVTVVEVDYLIATPVAVEAAVLHNFFWHERWTWGDRADARASVIGMLVRFQLATSVISISGGLVLMMVLVDLLQLHYLVANVLTIAACGMVNFVVANRLIFRVRPPCVERSAHDSHKVPTFEPCSVDDERSRIEVKLMTV